MVENIAWTAILVMVLTTLIIKNLDRELFPVPVQFIIIASWILSAITSLGALLIQIWS